MSSDASRRNFLAAGLALPVAGLAAQSPRPSTVPAAKPAAPSASQVTFRTLGKTGLKVSTLGFGCMITSDSSVVARGLDMGITYFDTARVYQGGNNERMVGSVLKNARKNIVLSSKSRSKTAAEAAQHLETSLKELGTDYLDIWYLHAVDNPAAITDELVSYWEKAKKEGKIRHIGISTHNPNAIVDRVMETGKYEVLLSTYNFTVGTANDTTYQRLHDAGIGLVAMKVVAPATPRRGPAGAPGEVRREDVGSRPGGLVAAIKWVLRNQHFCTCLPGMTDMDQLEMNFQAMTGSFTAADEKLLASIGEDIRPFYCRMCYQCKGQCPKGAAVPETIRYLSYNDFYGQFALGREHFMDLPDDVRNVNCGDCTSCSVKCPNGVRVHERLMRAQELFA